MFDLSNPLNSLIMKYVNTCGTLCVSSGNDAKFVDFMCAVMAMNAVQIFYARLGYAVHSDLCEKTKNLEVRIHFDSFDVPRLPAGYLFSSREITSQPFTGYNAQPCERVRVVSYRFDF